MTICAATACLAHASLVSSDPADRSILARAPETLTLEFSERVTPLVLKLIASGGTPVFLDPFSLDGKRLVVRAPARLAPGTYAFGWRIVSADGHPVGGSIVFSVGVVSPGALPQADDAPDPWARAALWMAKLAIYVGFFFGVGGAFWFAWIEPTIESRRRKEARAGILVSAALLFGLVAMALSVGLQGLDALGAPLAMLARGVVWLTGFSTTWGNTAIVGLLSMFAAFCATRSARPGLTRFFALAALVGVGLALAASGHASAASPTALTTPAVFLHGASIAIWIGALAPLAAALRDEGARGSAVLRRFSHAIPIAVAAIVLSGVLLAVIQLERMETLWSTDYGRVLLAKLAIVVALLGIAGWNRWALTPRINQGDGRARRRLIRMIIIELILAGLVLSLATSWRFTPPPRAILAAAAEPASLHLHTAAAIAEVTFSPGRAGRVAVSMTILTGNLGPLDAQQVVLTLANPAVGVEPMARPAYKAADGAWRIDAVTIPLPGLWSVRVDVTAPGAVVVPLDGHIEIRP
jgi:copper transport protein